MSNKRKYKKEELIQCTSCGKYKPRSSFYVSHSELYQKNGVLPYCKICIKKMCNDKFKKIDKEKTLKMLRTIDRPFIKSVWDKVVKKGGENAIGTYLKSINLVQYRDKKWDDGDLDFLDAPYQNMKSPLTPPEKLRTQMEKYDDFEVTSEIQELFGTGYTTEEYFNMWNKYNYLSENYSLETNMHKEALATYVRYKVKEEMAVAKGNPSVAKTWGELAMKQADKAKINPVQLSKADTQGGLTTIGEIAKEVEENIDIIPILPQFKFRPNDAVDFCIWCYINYARELEGKPKVEYEDTYKFYDKMREDYMATTGDAYGIFDNDPTLKNREKVKKFIQLPDDYNERSEEE